MTDKLHRAMTRGKKIKKCDVLEGNLKVKIPYQQFFGVLAGRACRHPDTIFIVDHSTRALLHSDSCNIGNSMMTASV